MLGIEYTRFSKITDRYERCKLQYGFYPAADYASKLSSVMMGLHRSCRSPEKSITAESCQSYNVISFRKFKFFNDRFCHKRRLQFPQLGKMRLLSMCGERIRITPLFDQQ